jgi:hypothetical protein
MAAQLRAQARTKKVMTGCRRITDMTAFLSLGRCWPDFTIAD